MMKRNAKTYAEKLDWFKANERPEGVLLIDGNHQLMRMLVAWSSVTIEPQCDVEAAACSDENAWNWLWESTSYDFEEWASKSGVSNSFFEENRAILVGNRLVYPDGTLNKFVERYLREKVLTLFETKGKKKKA